MGFGSSITYCPAGNRDPSTGSEEITEGSWHQVAVELFKFSPVVNWDVVQRDRNAMAGVMRQMFENSRGNSIYVDDGKG